MHPMLNVAVQAIRRSGNFLIKQYEFFNKNNTQTKHTNDFIINTYKESNQIIEKTIKKFYPLSIIITPENYNNFHNTDYYNKICWVINCIDNDLNFIRKFPFFALSISVQIKKKIEVGVIYDPIHNELFSACRGKGAQLNGYRIRINTAQKLYNSIICISYNKNTKNMGINLFNKLSHQYLDINFRHTGATSLDLAYLAAGRIDGCITLCFKQTNKILIDCGILIIRESGGLIVTNHTHRNDNGNQELTIVAGNSKITQSILSIID